MGKFEDIFEEVSTLSSKGTISKTQLDNDEILKLSEGCSSFFSKISDKYPKTYNLDKNPYEWFDDLNVTDKELLLSETLEIYKEVRDPFIYLSYNMLESKRYVSEAVEKIRKRKSLMKDLLECNDFDQIKKLIFDIHLLGDIQVNLVLTSVYKIKNNKK